MKVWTNVEFEGLWPVGAAAVVVAETAERAADLLRPVAPKPETVRAEDFREVDTSTEHALVLNDGNY